MEELNWECGVAYTVPLVGREELEPAATGKAGRVTARRPRSVLRENMIGYNFEGYLPFGNE